MESYPAHESPSLCRDVKTRTPNFIGPQIDGALGAEYVITGNVGKLGKSFMLSGRVIEAATARPAAKVTVKYEQGDCIAAAAEEAAAAMIKVGP